MARAKIAAIAGLVAAVLSGPAGCASSGGAGENVASTTDALTAQNTLSDVQARFLREIAHAPERLDKDLVNPRIEHRAVVVDNTKNAVSMKLGSFVGVDDAFAKLPPAADGAIDLQASGMHARVRLDGAASVGGAVASGYVVYPGAAPGGGAILLRPTQGAVEDDARRNGDCVFPSTTWNGASHAMLTAALSLYGSPSDARYIKFSDTGVDTGVNR